MISESIISFRTTRIGGSDIATLLGRGRFGGPASIAQRILGTLPKNDTYNPSFEFGNRWECQVAQLFAENNPNYLVVSVADAFRAGYIHKLPGFSARIVTLPDGSITLLDAEHNHLVLNVDYLVISRTGLGWGVLEIKTSSEFGIAEWGESGTDKFPSYYQDQPKYYCNRLGGSLVFGAVLIGQRDYREYQLQPYTEQEAANVVATVNEWYDRHIVKRMPVPPAFVESSDVAIEHDALEVSEDLYSKILEHREIYRQIEELNTKLQPLEEVIRAASATHSELTRWGEVLFKNTGRQVAELDVKRLLREMPDLYAKYTRPRYKKRFAKADGYMRIKPQSTRKAS